MNKRDSKNDHDYDYEHEHGREQNRNAPAPSPSGPSSPSSPFSPSCPSHPEKSDYEHDYEHEREHGHEHERNENAPAPDAPAEIPIEDFIDLHFFAPNEVKIVVEEYIEQAAARGFEEVRIIHGRGIGERRRQVQTILARHPLVARFTDAPGDRGGWGATIVWLRSPESARP